MLRAQIQITDQDARSINANKGSEYIGQVAHTVDGRTFVYSIAGASNLAAGLLTIAPASTANHIDQTGTANAVGTAQITYTLGATAAAAGLYSGGYFSVAETATTGIITSRIRTNTLANSANSYSVTVTLEPDEGLPVATTTASKFSLLPSPYNFTIVAPGDSSSYQTSGVPNVAVTATYSYWSQTSGYATVLSDGIIAKNVAAILSPSVSGAVVTDSTSGIVNRIGYAPEATVSAKYYPVVLTIQQ